MSVERLRDKHWSLTCRECGVRRYRNSYASVRTFEERGHLCDGCWRRSQTWKPNGIVGDAATTNIPVHGNSVVVVRAEGER